MQERRDGVSALCLEWQLCDPPANHIVPHGSARFANAGVHRLRFKLICCHAREGQMQRHGWAERINEAIQCGQDEGECR
eukprot:scaffold328360_cov73-Tisochrysis_lutea.AAC.1